MPKTVPKITKLCPFKFLVLSNQHSKTKDIQFIIILRQRKSVNPRDYRGTTRKSLRSLIEKLHYANDYQKSCQVMFGRSNIDESTN